MPPQAMNKNPPVINVEQLATQLINLPILMSVMGHTTIAGHQMYRDDRDPATYFIRWLSNQTPHTWRNMINHCYGGKTKFDQLRTILVEGLPRIPDL